MAVPFSYSLRNLGTRRLTTALTASGMGLVVFVFAAMQMLAAGLRETLVETGSWDNVVLIRKASVTEVQSGIELGQAALVELQPEIAADRSGRPLVAKETVVLVNLPKRDQGKPANILVRGIAPASAALRPQVRLTLGRWPRPGTSEVVAGRGVVKRIEGAALGQSLRFALRDWTIVGVFDAGATGFDSELWGDGDQMRQAFRRPVYSSVVLKLADPGAFDALKARLEADPRLTVEAKREAQFYADQSEAMATFLKVFGAVLSVIFSLGAVLGAMITMYAAVANRVGEIGTLRALGFGRRSILAAFLLESLLLGLLGGAAGVGLAAWLQLFSLSTVNWQTFAELAFRFRLTAPIALQSLAFALVMGLLGGLLPALRAARMGLVDALRAS